MSATFFGRVEKGAQATASAKQSVRERINAAAADHHQQ